MLILGGYFCTTHNTNRARRQMGARLLFSGPPCLFRISHLSTCIWGPDSTNRLQMRRASTVYIPEHESRGVLGVSLNSVSSFRHFRNVTQYASWRIVGAGKDCASPSASRGRNGIDADGHCGSTLDKLWGPTYLIESTVPPFCLLPPTRSLPSLCPDSCRI